MSSGEHDALLNSVLERVIENNQQIRPGTPMADLKEAIESAMSSLPPLEFEEFSQVLEDSDAEKVLLERAPELIGWNADQIIEWVEEISKKI